MADPDAEIILAMNRIGSAMEVRAISAGDGLEVSFTAPANAAKSDLEKLARQKLAYVRSRGSSGGGGQGGPPAGGSSGGGRGGIIA